MLNKVLYIILIGLISHIYNIIIYPNIILIIDPLIYNDMIMFLLMIIQIDSIIIYNDYKKNDKNLDIDIYMKIISSQLSIIINNQEEIKKSKIINKKITRSYNDIYRLQ
jgi:hypothetical protein